MAASYVSLDELVEAIGGTAAAKLVAAYGGTQLYVPAEPRRSHPLVQAIGPEAAAALARHLSSGIGGLTIELPRGAAGATAELRRRVRAAAGDPNRSEAEIARELRVHGRTVRRARASLRGGKASGQGRLF